MVLSRTTDGTLLKTRVIVKLTSLAFVEEFEKALIPNFSGDPAVTVTSVEVYPDPPTNWIVGNWGSGLEESLVQEDKNSIPENSKVVKIKNFFFIIMRFNVF